MKRRRRPPYSDAVGAVFEEIDETLAAWIAEQPMFFVATAPLAGDGLVNVSPRGHDTFSVLGPHRVGWVDYTGSGVETVAHLRENGRICVMFCAFGASPRVVRLHGRGSVHLPGTPEFDEVAAQHPSHPGTRAVVTVDVRRISDACGFGVPVMDLLAERSTLRVLADRAAPGQMAEYRARSNARSIDGLPGMPDVAP
ncbi:pyridoxamine 5'-phosphate oxidase family protein [Sporichthya brevicatena]|jgi:hypothetical protein|uniref:Pyridoxamine 5'-phosphate oxidase family protein n=1 Tax=Sporichthya brevicatena TaxID=171442 RepID=A0ABN1HB24_9ACTN